MDMVPCYKSKAILTCSLTWSIQDSATSYGFPSNRQYFRHLKVVVENYFNIFPNTIMLYIIYRSNTILVIILKQETYEKKPIMVGNLHYIKSHDSTRVPFLALGTANFMLRGAAVEGSPSLFESYLYHSIYTFTFKSHCKNMLLLSPCHKLLPPPRLIYSF